MTCIRSVKPRSLLMAVLGKPSPVTLEASPATTVHWELIYVARAQKHCLPTLRTLSKFTMQSLEASQRATLIRVGISPPIKQKPPDLIECYRVAVKRK